jgi:hypothetical protein
MYPDAIPVPIELLQMQWNGKQQELQLVEGVSGTDTGGTDDAGTYIFSGGRQEGEAEGEGGGMRSTVLQKSRAIFTATATATDATSTVTATATATATANGEDTSSPSSLRFWSQLPAYITYLTEPVVSFHTTTSPALFKRRSEEQGGGSEGKKGQRSMSSASSSSITDTVRNNNNSSSSSSSSSETGTAPSWKSAFRGGMITVSRHCDFYLFVVSAVFVLSRGIAGFF